MVNSYSSLMYSEAHILIEIESFTESVLNKTLSESAAHEQLAHHLFRWLSIYSQQLDYTKHIQLFWSACAPLTPLIPHVPWSFLQTQAITTYINRSQNKPSLQRELYDRRYQMKSNHISLTNLAKHYHNQHSKVLVCRVDLGYSHHYAHGINVFLFYQHLDHLLKCLNQKNRTFLSHLIGYAWSLEQGIHKGYHIHLLMYFHASYHQKGWFLANEVAHLWLNIVGECGSYFNCHHTDYIERFTREGTLGIGVIHRDDKQACDNAINRTAGYLTDPKKDNQYMRCRPKKRRCFGTSTFKTPHKPNILLNKRNDQLIM